MGNFLVCALVAGVTSIKKEDIKRPRKECMEYFVSLPQCSLQHQLQKLGGV